MISALKSRLDDSVELFADVVMRPDFPDAEVERQRSRRLVRLTQLEDSAGYVAGVALDRVVYGGHPYARPAFGDFGLQAMEHLSGTWMPWIQTWYSSATSTTWHPMP